MIMDSCDAFAERNTSLMLVLQAGHTTIDELYAALLQREDTILDYLRLAAAQQGLMPSMTQMILMHSGLGTPVSKDFHDRVLAQVEDEIAELQRRMEGGSG